MVEYWYFRKLIFLILVKVFSKKSIHIIILPEHIGDVIAFTPFAEMLKGKYKNAYILWLIKPNYLPIIKNNNYINDCMPISCDGLAQKFSTLKMFYIYDVRFNGNNFCPICQTERKFQKIDEAFNLDNYYEYGSLLEIFSKLAKQPMVKEDWFPLINIDENTISEIKKLNLPAAYICIHTNSVDPKREWPIEKWGLLIEQIFKIYNLKIVQVGLKDDLKIKSNDFIDLSGKLSLIQTAEVIKNSVIYIGIDSGPAHIANAVGAKSIILMGKYRKTTNYMPFSGNFAVGKNSKIIYNPQISLPQIEVSEVLGHVQKFLSINVD